MATTDDSIPVLGCYAAAYRTILTDPSTGTPTFGTVSTVHAAVEVGVETSADSKELKDGYGRIVAKQSSAATGVLTLKFAKWSPQMHADIFGSNLVTDADGAVHVQQKTTDTAKFIDFEGISAPVESGANVGLRAYKIKAQKPGGMTLTEDDYTGFEIPFDVFERESDHAWVDWTEYPAAKTAADLLTTNAPATSA